MCSERTSLLTSGLHHIMSRLHVVVGGGSSGLALVRKLLEVDDVILIERGKLDQEQGPGPKPTFFEKIANIYPSICVWCYLAFVDVSTLRVYTEPQSCLNGRQLCYSQGYGGGGSGGVNAMIYTLGNRLVYDKMWPKEWKYDRIQNFLNNLLHFYTPNIVNTSGNVAHILRSSLEIAPNSDQATTVVDNKSIVTSYYTTIHSSGVDRTNQASILSDAFTSKARKGTLTVVPHCIVVRVQFDGNTATSLLVSRRVPTSNGYDFERQEIKPERGGEIILCAGAFESPRILLASGLGSDKRIKTSTGSYTDTKLNTTGKENVQGAKQSSSSPALSLPTLMDIGQNLQDHCVLPYMLLGNWHSHWHTFHAHNVPHYANRPAYPLNGIHGWVNLNADGSVWGEDSSSPPSVQLLFIDGRVSASIIPNMLPKFPPGSGVYATYIYPVLFAILQFITSLAVVRWACGYFFGILVCLTDPRSRGSLRVNPADPTGPLLIDPNYLHDPADKKALYQGLQTARRMVQRAATAPGADLRALEVLPGPLFAYANSWDMFTLFARLLTNPYYHACGTCAMRSDDAHLNDNPPRAGKKSKVSVEKQSGGEVVRGVVDIDFKVLGVNKLRVADASVIPAIPSSPTQALCMVLGEACGHIVLRDT